MDVHFDSYNQAFRRHATLIMSTIKWRGSRSISQNACVLDIPHRVDDVFSNNNPNYMETLYRGGPGSIPGQPILELCRTKWHCFFPSFSVLPNHLWSHENFYTLICPPGPVQLAPADSVPRDSVSYNRNIKWRPNRIKSSWDSWQVLD
jgi:hypothetical protein